MADCLLTHTIDLTRTFNDIIDKRKIVNSIRGNLMRELRTENHDDLEDVDLQLNHDVRLQADVALQADRDVRLQADVDLQVDRHGRLRRGDVTAIDDEEARRRRRLGKTSPRIFQRTAFPLHVNGLQKCLRFINASGLE